MLLKQCRLYAYSDFPFCGGAGSISRWARQRPPGRQLPVTMQGPSVCQPLRWPSIKRQSQDPQLSFPRGLQPFAPQTPEDELGAGRELQPPGLQTGGPKAEEFGGREGEGFPLSAASRNENWTSGEDRFPLPAPLEPASPLIAAACQGWLQSELQAVPSCPWGGP